MNYFYIMKPVDLVVLIITIAIAIIIVSIVLVSVITGNKVSPDGLKILGDLLIALTSIIALYVGSKIKR